MIVNIAELLLLCAVRAKDVNRKGPNEKAKDNKPAFVE